MAKVSKNFVSKDTEQFIWKSLLEVFRDVKTNDEAEIILNDLLTPSEKIMLSKRLAIAFLLMRGKSYVEISKKLKVSFATIGLVKSAKLRGGRGYSQLLEAILKNQKLIF